MRLPTVELVPRPAAVGYGARLGELLLRLAITPETPLDINTVPVRADRIQTADSPEEFLVGEFPAFSLGDLTGGEGLYFAHRRAQTERDPTRFWRSSGIDNAPQLPGMAAGIRLLHSTELALADTAATPYLVTLDTGDVFFADGPNVTRVTGVLSGTPGTASEDPFTGTANLTGLVRLGDELFASSGDGISKRSVGGTWAALTGPLTTIDRLWAAKGRLIGAVDNVLHELDSVTGASAATLLTIPVGRVFTAVVDAGSAILVAASDGVVYSMALDTAALTLTGQTQMPIGEWATCLGAAFGRVLIGTTHAIPAGGYHGHLYVADVASQTEGFVLTGIQLYRHLDQESETVNRSPMWITQRENSLYVAARANGQTTLWRFHLATGSLTEDLVFAAEATVYGLVVVAESLVIALGGVGLYRETDDYLDYGYLIGPAADFFSASIKAWMAARVQVSGVGVSNSRLRISIATDLAALADPNSVKWTPLTTIYDLTQAGEIIPIAQTLGRYGMMKLELFSSDDGQTTPVMESVTFFTYPQPEEIVARLPVNVSDRIEWPNHRPFTLRGYGKVVLSELLTRVGRPEILEIYKPPLQLSGAVETVENRSPGVGERSNATLVGYLVFRGRLLEAASAPGGPGTLGIGTLGIEIMGI